MALTQEELNAAFGLGLEDNDLNVSVNATHEGEEDEGEGDNTLGGEIDTSDQPEAAELDLDDAADDVEEAADKVEDLEQAEQALESLYLTALNIGAEAFTPATAKIFNCAVDQSLVAYGLSASDIGIASSEDFEYSPLSAYTDSMEKIGETLNTARKNAGKWIAEMWAKFVKFLSEMFDSAKRAKTKTQKLLAAGEKTTEQANEKITVPAFLGPDFSAKRIENFNAVLKALITVKYADIASGISKDGIDDATVGIAFASAMMDVAKFTGKTFIGDIELKAGKEKGELQVVHSSRGNSKASTISAPSVAEGKNIGKALLATSDHIIAYNEKKDVRKRFNDHMAKQIADGEKAASGDDKKDGFFKRRAALRKASSLWRLTNSFEKSLIRHGVTLVNMGNNALFQILKPKKAEKKKKEAKK